MPEIVEPDRSECERLLARAFEYIDAKMSLAELEQARAHLEGCPDCGIELGIEIHLRQLLRRSCCESAPERLRIRIVEQITILRSQQQ